MKIHHYSYDPKRKLPDFSDIQKMDLGDDCIKVVLARDEDPFYLRAEGIIIKGIFVAILTVDRNVENDMKWRLVFHEMTNKELKKIGNRFKRVAPYVVYPYSESMENILLEDWPRIFNNRILDCDHDKITVSTTNGTPLCEHLFSE